MAQLTLTERSNMANNGLFQQRLRAALKKTANYWKDYATDALNKYNVAVQKKKVFARQILQGVSDSNMQAYAEYLLSQYNEEAPVLVQEPDAAAGQLADAALTDSAASSGAFDYFAGVEAGDDSKQIQL